MKKSNWPQMIELNNQPSPEEIANEADKGRGGAGGGDSQHTCDHRGSLISAGDVRCKSSAFTLNGARQITGNLGVCYWRNHRQTRGKRQCFSTRKAVTIYIYTYNVSSRNRKIKTYTYPLYNTVFMIDNLRCKYTCVFLVVTIV